MARKFQPPGKHFKAFGQERPQEQVAPGTVSVTRSGSNARAPERSWLASRMEMLNIVLFTFFAILGYIQYFIHHAPVANSLSMGIGFTLILGLYLYMVRHRQQVRNRK